VLKVYPIKHHRCKHEGVPAEHHDGGLRVGSRRGVESGAVDDAQRVEAEHSVLGVDDPADLAAAVVVPDGHDGVPAELFQRRGVVIVPGQQVHRESGRHVEQRLHGEVGVREVLEGLGLDDALDDRQAGHAAAEVLGVREVVERHRRVVVGVAVAELEVARGQRAEDLLQDEAAAESRVVELPHRLRGARDGLRRALLRGHGGQLPRLQERRQFSESCTATGHGLEIRRSIKVARTLPVERTCRNCGPRPSALPRWSPRCSSRPG
jgi:hypothetical protein